MKKVKQEQHKPYNLILASQSPRRRELIQLIHPNVRFLSTDVEESYPEGLEPEQIVQIIAEKKARAVRDLIPSAEREDSLIIGCDTIVSLNGKIYGKPEDEACAKRMLEELSGKTHQVFTGVSILYGDGHEINFAEKTNVTFRTLNEEEILRYIESGEPMDKAGAYGIQGDGRKFVDSFDGDYDNVIGLPVYRLTKILRTIED